MTAKKIIIGSFLLLVAIVLFAGPRIDAQEPHDLDALPANATLVYGQRYDHAAGLAPMIRLDTAEWLYNQVLHSHVVVSDLYDGDCNCWMLNGEQLEILPQYTLTFDVPEIRGPTNYRVWLAQVGELHAVIVSQPSNTRSAEDRANGVWHCASSMLVSGVGG